MGEVNIWVKLSKKMPGKLVFIVNEENACEGNQLL